MVERFHLGPGTLAYARALGIDIRTGGRPALSLEPRAYYALFDGIAAHAEAIYQGVFEHFGFATLDPPLLIGLCSENLAAAATRIARYKPLIGPLQLDITQDPNGLRLRLNWPDSPTVPPLLHAIEMLFWIALARKGPVETQQPTRLALPAVPPMRDAFERIAGLRLSIADQPELLFAPKAAQAPFATRRDDLVHMFEQSLGVMATRTHLIATLRRTLVAALPAGRGTITVVAAELGMSTRSLQRHLGDMGTSFRQELAAVRTALAAQVTEERGYSAADTAFVLGFRDVNSLYRARKGWGTHTAAQRIAT